MRITVVGHSTVLIGVAGRRILTDPYFGTRGNPAYVRTTPPGLAREALLDVDLVPVTTYRIPMTMGEKGAVKAVRDLGAPVVIPIHLAVVPRSPLSRTRQSPDGFTRRLREAGLDNEVVVLAPGESWRAGRRPYVLRD
ncbi:MAG: hypothetical protein PVJ02_02490, partial [Gemmatimonadota bacterium]